MTNLNLLLFFFSNRAAFKEISAHILFPDNSQWVGWVIFFGIFSSHMEPTHVSLLTEFCQLKLNGFFFLSSFPLENAKSNNKKCLLMMKQLLFTKMTKIALTVQPLHNRGSIHFLLMPHPPPMWGGLQPPLSMTTIKKLFTDQKK